MTKQKQVDIWQYVMISNHGGFLSAFGDAMARADDENLDLLNDVSCKLIKKYNLEEEYLKYKKEVSKWTH